MKASFVSGVMLTVIPEDGDSIDYKMTFGDCHVEGPYVVLACGEESVIINEGAWAQIKEQIDGLFMDEEA